MTARPPYTADDPPAIRTEALTKRFGRSRALDGVDLVVPRHVVFGYLGPNGSGKTTTIRILAGLMRPTSGRAEVLGHDVGRDRETAQACIGYLPGNFVGYPDLTGREFLTYLANLRGGVDWARVDLLAERLTLDLERRLGTLSHGNRQKVGIVQAMMHDPELLILDEPTSGLDPLVQREFLALLRAARDRGRTVFLSSHVLSEVEAVADEVAILREGRLVVADRVSALEQQAVRRIDLVFTTTPPVGVLAGVSGVLDVRAHERSVTLTVEGSTAALIEAAAPYGVENLVTHEPDLEEVFLDWYSPEQAAPC